VELRRLRDRQPRVYKNSLAANSTLIPARRIYAENRGNTGGGGAFILMLVMSVILFACETGAKEEGGANEVKQIDLTKVLEYMLSLLDGAKGSNLDITNEYIFTSKIPYNKVPDLPSEYNGFLTLSSYQVTSATLGKEVIFSEYNPISIAQGVFGDTNATVTGTTDRLLYSAGGTSAYTGDSIALTVGAFGPGRSSRVVSVTLPVDAKDLARVNNLRVTAGSFSNKYNGNTTINTVNSMVDLVAAGSVGTLISGDSPGAYISTYPDSGTGVVLKGGILTAKSIVTNGGDILQDYLSADSFTLGTLSNGMLYIEDADSASQGGTVTGSATVYFHYLTLSSGNLDYIVGSSYVFGTSVRIEENFGVVVLISR
jgi:hypothetical protein